MMSDFIKELNDAMEYAPKNPTVTSDLSGWTLEGAGSVCSYCAGRIMARGMGHLFQKWSPVWLKKDFNGCELVGHAEKV